MNGLDRLSWLNRALLALIGALLLASGGFGLAARFAALDVLPADAPLVPGVEPPPPWAWWLTAACGVVLGLLAAGWLAAQASRGPRSPTWRSGAVDGRTELAASTAIAPLLAEVGACPGVRAVRGALAGPLESPALALVISTGRGGDPGAIRHELVTRVLPRLRRALDLAELPTTVEFHVGGEPGPRTGALPPPGAGT
ncbi:alkaline shock response membrane anchor protein AmaP [Actinosynnema pretiosum]|uniref:Alkaline shock response membrane anchor protein AmaP n=1 Tax=Actinosynnema pretiosum TaxID=42197 RepID=A0A290Z9W8_9PSEU|nr:alkaline shock response membrane anchor protein AmaP [Actinosynnema pretiosum]ATE55786.1 alkaline shock response membrane anchor protein AmaP [Actinosynnema pretiosum]